MGKWYETALRYGQTNLTEIDPQDCDLSFWREYWKKTGTEAIIINAGGIVAYYPSKFKLHYRAAKLNGKDFFGEYAAAGREAGLAILARMDINRAVEEFYQERPDWFARKKDGSPYIVQGRYQSCINSGYYKEFIPELLKEIISLYHPDGFTDNSWTGIPRTSICYCDNCKQGFRDYCGKDLPVAADYDDPVYRQWITWSYKCRIDNWDLFNKVTTEYGGEDCVWLGMVNANFVSGHASFCNLRDVAKRSKIMMVDHQGRDGNGFEQNSLNGMLLHQLAGWDVVIPESMATYVRGLQTFRRAPNTRLELELWMLTGFAGGITPWWHIVGGAQEDKRIFDLCVPMMQWHKAHEKYLYHRRPVANVGVLWSQDNVEFFGGSQAHDRVELSWRGINMALTRAGVPFLPINTEDLPEQSKGLELLILPELAVITETCAKELEAFAARGGSILAIGSIGVIDESGATLPVCRLEELLGVHFQNVSTRLSKADASWENPVLHNYLRIETPESVVFAGFENTTTLPMGGTYREISAGEGTETLATYIPVYPIYPPEFSWSDTTRTTQPVLTERMLSGGGKAMYAAWDLDASYGRCALPDHGDLLGNMVKYLLADKAAVQVECDAYIDFKCYRQENRVIVHLINVNHTGFDHGFAEKILPVGPVRVTIREESFCPAAVTATEDGIKPSLHVSGNTAVIELDQLNVHQLLIIE